MKPLQRRVGHARKKSVFGHMESVAPASKSLTKANSRFGRTPALWVGIFLVANLAVVPSALASDEPSGGTLYTVPGVGLAPPAGVNGFNPLLTSSAYDSQVEGTFYQPLLWVNSKFHIDYHLSVARKIVVGPQHKTFTIYLHHFWKWSDGSPVTALDVAYTYHMILKLGPLYPGYGTGGIPKDILSFSVITPYEIRIVTKHPVNRQWFELGGISDLTPLPQQEWSRYSVHELNENLANPSFFRVVDGPFKLDSFQPGRYVSIVRNDAYSGPDPARLHKVVFRFLHSNSSVFFALKRGTIELGNLPAPLYPARHELSQSRVVVVGPPWGFNYLGFNFSNPHIAFVRNVLVRQAMMHAIDQDLLIKILGFGHGIRAYGLVPTSPETFLSPEAKALKKRGAYDPNLANKLLREAGWRRGPDGIREKNGQRMSFILYMPPSMVRGPTLVAQMLRRVGIEVHLRERPFNEVYAEMTDPQSQGSVKDVANGMKS